MRTRLILLAAGLGVLLLSAGCSSLIFYATSLTGSETPPQPRLALTRDDVKAKLGKPLAVTPLPDGGQVATYEYRLRDRAAEGKALDTAAFHLFLWKELRELGVVISVLAEPVFTGMAIYNAANPSRGQVTFTVWPGRPIAGLRLASVVRPPG